MKRRRPKAWGRGRDRTAAAGRAIGLIGIVAVAGCDSATGPLSDCSIPIEEFVDGGLERSEIPALSNPTVAGVNHIGVAFIPFNDRVIGITFNGQPLAIPHRILWQHEIVNLTIPGEKLVVSYSPLTGSSLVFDRSAALVDSFGVSKYVYETNLVMADESGTLWPQMVAAASCGPRDGVRLKRVPHEEMTYGAWAQMHPDTWVVSRATGYDFFYTLYPYGDYEEPDNTELRFPIDGVVDTRRPPKERVLGIPSSGGGIAFPLSLLDQLRDSVQIVVSVANETLDGEPITVFWNAVARSAIPYRAAVDGQTLTFEVVDGRRRDRETGTRWDFFGEGFDGPLAGARLERIPDAFMAFWFAWADFYPDTDLWAPAVPASVTPGFLGLPPGPIDWRLSRR